MYYSKQIYNLIYELSNLHFNIYQDKKNRFWYIKLELIIKLKSFNSVLKFIL